MKIIKTKLKDLVLVKSKVFTDKRGFFKEIEKKNILKKKFVFDCFSYSKRNTLRGLHLQTIKSQAKFITVVQGKILDVVVDCRTNSSTFGKSFKIILSQKNSKSIFIPPGFIHGFLGLEDENIVVYGCTNYRNKDSEIGVIWNDSELNIKWPVKKPILSVKDKKNISFQDFLKL